MKAKMEISRSELDNKKRYGLFLRAMQLGFQELGIKGISFSTITEENGFIAFEIEKSELAETRGKQSFESDPNSKAYPVGDKDHPQIPKGQSVFLLRTQMGIIGKDNYVKGIPKKMKKAIVPPFMIIATDRIAAIAEITRLWNELFDAYEKQEQEGKSNVK